MLPPFAAVVKVRMQSGFDVWPSKDGNLSPRGDTRLVATQKITEANGRSSKWELGTLGPKNPAPFEG